MRLIDADALIERMEQREEELKDDRSMWETAAVETALDMFAPTVKAIPIEVLQEIRQKIEGDIENLTYYPGEVNPISAMKDCLEIIDKHIAEVEG